MKKFRDKEVIGWTLVVSASEKNFISMLNKLMDRYDFIDCQYSTCPHKNNAGRMYIEYSALVLIGKKDE